jgi:hypothetical protein
MGSRKKEKSPTSCGVTRTWSRQNHIARLTRNFRPRTLLPVHSTGAMKPPTAQHGGLDRVSGLDRCLVLVGLIRYSVRLPR